MFAESRMHEGVMLKFLLGGLIPYPNLQTLHLHRASLVPFDNCIYTARANHLEKESATLAGSCTRSEFLGVGFMSWLLLQQGCISDLGLVRRSSVIGQLPQGEWV